MRKYVDLLKRLIKVKSYSGYEDDTADILSDFVEHLGYDYERIYNNIIVIDPNYDSSLPSVLLNSHHDTVKATRHWNNDPYGAVEEGGRLIGLGSNDAGGPLVSLMAAFDVVSKMNNPFNLILAATGEEENFGEKGIASILDIHLPPIDLGIIGEPTSLEMAIAEKGLMVLDGVTEGRSAHAARNNGINAINKAIEDIRILFECKLEKISEVLGRSSIQVTQISAGTQHNVIPDRCEYVVDIRFNECYSNVEILEILQNKVHGTLTPRSLRWNSKGLSRSHQIVKRGQELGIPIVGSPTLSDQMQCNFPTIKIGPGDSNRSHTPDEYIYINEIEEGINTYIDLLKGLKL